MIEAGVRAQLSRNDGAFLRSAGDADDFHARKLAELDGITADRAGGGRHNEGLTRHRAAEHLHRAIGGEARRAECRQPQGLVEFRVAGSKSSGLCDGVFLPAKPSGNEVAVSQVFSFDDLTQYIAIDQFADCERRGVVLEVLEALTLPRRQGGNQHADQDFAALGRGDRRGFDAKMRIARQVGRSDGQMEAAVGV